MGFWDKQVRNGNGRPAPARAPGGWVQPQQRLRRYYEPEPPASGWEGAPPAAEPYQQMFEGEITPETHPQFFTIGPDGRPVRSPFTWRGDRRGALTHAGECPNCGGPNYIEPKAPDGGPGHPGGQGAGTAGIINSKTGQKAFAAPRCTDCGYPRLQQGSGASLTGRIMGQAPSAEVGNFVPVFGAARLDRATHKYVKVGE